VKDLIIIKPIIRRFVPLSREYLIRTAPRILQTATNIQKEKFSIHILGEDLVSLLISELLPPTGLSINGTVLSWIASETTDIDGYNVYLKQGAGDFIKQNTSIVIDLSFDLGSLDPDTYEAYVTSVRNTEESVPSEILQFTIVQPSHIITNGTNQAILMPILNFRLSLDNCSIQFRFTSNNTSKAMLLGANHGTLPDITRIWINTDKNESASAGRIAVQIRDDNNNGRRMGTIDSLNINDGVPHELTLTIENFNTWKLYLDGVEVAMELTSFSSWQKTLSLYTEPFEIGIAGNAEVDPNFNLFRPGGLDELRFWTEVLTEQKINDNLRSSVNPAEEPNLFAYYKCDDGSGDSLVEEVSSITGSLHNNVSDNMWVSGDLEIP